MKKKKKNESEVLTFPLKAIAILFLFLLFCSNQIEFFETNGLGSVSRG